MAIDCKFVIANTFSRRKPANPFPEKFQMNYSLVSVNYFTLSFLLVLVVGILRGIL